jgi:hypothetical protein
MTDERATIDRDPETSSESDAPPEGDSSAGELAADLRALLGARQEVETLLEEASEARRAAAAEGEEILAQAQRVAEELTAGARQDAERESAAARERAARIVAEAKAEAEEIRGKAAAEGAAARAAADAELRTLREQARVGAADEARAEFDALRQEANQLFGQLEERFGTVRSTLTDAESAMRSTLERLDQLRATVGGEAVFALPARGSERALEPSEHLPAEAEVGPELSREGPGAKEARPRGWLFRHHP